MFGLSCVSISLQLTINQAIYNEKKSQFRVVYDNEGKPRWNIQHGFAIGCDVLNSYSHKVLKALHLQENKDIMPKYMKKATNKCIVTGKLPLKYSCTDSE